MDIVEQGIIVLAKSAITGEKQPWPEGFRLSQAMDFLGKCNIVSIGYQGALNCGCPEHHPVLKYLLDYHCVSIYNSERQMEEISRVCQALEENGIDYMPLKGTIMKSKYPHHAMRTMSDADILIRQEQYDACHQVLQGLGFQKISESDHECGWKNENLKIDLHKRLVSSDDPVYYNYFGDGWSFAKQKQGHRYAMSNEDAFIFEIVHFTKHYCKGGISIRHAIDLWVHLYTAPDIDKVYIRQQLAKMQLEVFYDHIMNLLAAWFEDGPMDAYTEHISSVLFDSTSTASKKDIAESARAAQRKGSVAKGKYNILLRKIFPEKKHIEWNYPKLKKLPLPIAWVARWCNILLFKQDTVRESQEKLQSVTTEEIENYRQSLEFVGLQFPE